MNLRMRVELVIFTFALALFLTAQTKLASDWSNMDWTTNSIPNNPTNGFNLLELTNNFAWETPEPSRVTIWFQYQWDNHFEFYPAALGSISTNAWPVTVSNATEMVKARLKSQGSEWKFITLTGIWRDE